MTQHIGVDIVEIKRIQKVIAHWKDRFLKRVFTPKELSLYSQRNSSLAVRFAAKEAVLKSLGACDSGISWQDIEVLAETNGKPIINLSGKARMTAQQLSIKELVVSLSHSEDYAVAFVVGITD
jgi:holo-[acyl-carrier protein] synthase